jgi:hypothetical protein
MALVQRYTVSLRVEGPVLIDLKVYKGALAQRKGPMC